MEVLQILVKNMAKKSDIRRKTIQERLLMSEEEVLEKSRMITKMVLGLQEYQRADTIFCYVDFRKEVRTREIIEESWCRKKTVAVPKVEGDVMKFYQVKQWSDLKAGYMGILEPEESCEEICAENRNSLMIMPGVAFDEKRNRIGYGGGYYDKYLSQTGDIYKVAVAFEHQVYQELPCEEHDLRPDIIVTEKRKMMEA